MEGIIYDLFHSPRIFQTLLLLLVAIFFFHAILRKKKGGSRVMSRPLPSPPALPLIGHLHLMGKNVQECFHLMASRYGPILHLRMGFSQCVLVSDSRFAKEILKEQELNFLSRPVLPAPNHLYKGAGFFSAPYGTYWRYMKKMCMTKLLSISQLNQLMHVREEELTHLLKSLMEISKKGEACNLGEKFVQLTNNAICRMAMSTRCSENADEAREVKELVDEMVFLGGKLSMGEILGPWVAKLDLFGYGKRISQVLGRFDKRINMIIEKKEKEKMAERRDEGVERRSQDLLDILLQTAEDPDAEFKLTKSQVKAFFLDIFSGGTETTATAMQWAMAELINNPTIFNRLRREIESVVGSTRLIKESDVPKLPYLQAVLKETLRLHPPLIFVLRRCENDCVVKGFELKAESRMLINVYSIMRDPNNWIEPTHFNPERFMVENERKQSFEYLPFGSGRRYCPGSTVALLEAHVVVGSLVQCFDWRTRGGRKINTREGSDGLVLKMEHPLECYPLLVFDPFKDSE